MGTQTILSGSVTKGKDNSSQQLQMISKPLMSPDDLKSMPKGTFVVMKTGTHPLKTRLKLFMEWGITFEKPYVIPEKVARKVKYADKDYIEKEIIRRYQSRVCDETDEGYDKNSGGIGEDEIMVEYEVMKHDGSITREIRKINLGEKMGQ